MNKYTIFLVSLLTIHGPASPFLAVAHAQAEPRTAADFCAEGNKYVKSGKPEDALESFSNAIKIDAQCAKAYSNRGVLLFAMGRYAESVVDLNKAVDLQPTNADAYFNRASALARLGKAENAIADITKAIRFNYSDLHEAYLLRGRVYSETEEHDKAIPDLTECIRLKPNRDVGYMHRGTAYHELGHLDDAVADYTKAIQLNPTRAETYALRAQTYREKKEKKKERADWIQATQLGLDEIRLLNDEKVDVFGDNPIVFVQKSCMPGSGYVWPASEVTDLLPPLDKDVQRYIADWKYRTHCLFRQDTNSDEGVRAIVAIDDSRQCIYWVLFAHLDRFSGGIAWTDAAVPLWRDGMVHEYDGRVTLGDQKKTWLFEPASGTRLVFEVAAEKGYIHKSGTGKVTLPGGKVVVLKDNEPGTVLGQGRAKTP